MISNINSNYILDDFYYAYNIEDIHDFKGGKKVKLYIPILMPDIDTSTRKSTTKQVYCEGILLNDLSCKPSINKKISFDYYIEGIVSFNSDFKHIINKNNVVPKGTQFKCFFTEGDINRCFIDSDISIN